jgi:hypothetical protein
MRSSLVLTRVDLNNEAIYSASPRRRGWGEFRI